MIADDMREELKVLDDDGLKSIVGYCIGIIDCRVNKETKTFKVKPCHNSEFNGIKCLESEDQFGFFKSSADVRPGHATWIDKEVTEKVYRVFETIFKNQRDKAMNFIEALESYTNDWDDLCDCEISKGEKSDGNHNEGCMTMKIRKDISERLSP